MNPGVGAMVAALLVLASPAGAQSPWRVDSAGTQVHWEVGHFGTSTARGRFDRVDTVLEFDPAARRGTVAVTVDTASVATGLPIFDRVLRGADLLDASAHPQAWFVGSRFEFDGDRPRMVHGEITLRGTSRPLTLRVTRFDCIAAAPPQPARCGAELEADLQRSDFGLNYALPWATNRVRIVVYASASPPH